MYTSFQISHRNRLTIGTLEILKNMLIKIQPDATVCRYLFTAKSLYMFRVSQHPSSGVLKTVTAASGTGHNSGTATSLQRGLISLRWREVAVPILLSGHVVHRYIVVRGIGTATSLQRGLIRPRWREVAVPLL